ncbi:uncharacterized protein [Ptychodera flava]|uniref:uncharacterized protein n=1 Tax=Ptychodera flava TaxID=63121 RepID=UPI00396A5BFF
MLEFDKNEKEILVLSKLQGMEYTADSTRRGKRQKSRFRYDFEGLEVCRTAWQFIYVVGNKEFRNLKKHYVEHGVVPRRHGNKGKRPPNAFSFETLRKAVQFIQSFAQSNGIPMAAAPSGRDSHPPVYLPASSRKEDIHMSYKQTCEAEGDQYVGLTLFKNLWRECVPHIKILTPRTDICPKCEHFRQKVSHARTEVEKVEAVTEFSRHLETAKQKREFYLNCTKQAKEELDNQVANDCENGDPCSVNLHKVHYTFDFAQSILIPHLSNQISPFYFLSLRKIHLFGINNEGTSKQVNYLLDESQTIGIDGTKSHGPNTVISMLHHYLSTYSVGEKGAIFHCDNCPGQNKNKTMIHYLLWRCAVGLHDNATLAFMEVGHTKCINDACFGLLKKLYRRSDIYSLAELVNVVNKSAKCNIADGYQLPTDDAPRFQWYDWVDFFSQFFLPLRGISKFSVFKFTKSEPGVVFVKDQLNSDEVKYDLRKRGVQLPSNSQYLPDMLIPPGLSVQRKRYLYSKIRLYIPDHLKDTTCPRP